MDPARWERIQALFHEAADLPVAERRPFVVAQAGGDADLAAQVLSLLEADAGTAPLLDAEVAEAARDVLSSGDAPLPAGPFGPYRVRGILGEGGMGVVYLGERDDLGTLAAIKILRDASLSPARRERFRNEQRTLAQLQHPGIAGLYDADTLPDGTPWFVMEYVDGLPLTDYCRVRGTSVPGRLQLFRAVCEAVQHAHRHAVIHRDLKPSNIFVKPDGTVKLLDFGIAKQLESLEEAVDQTQTGLRLMTPAYAAPEQLRGDRVGIHTDIYALGVVLYELLTGRLPFDLANRTPVEAVALVSEQEPVRPSVLARQREPTVTGPARARPVSRAAWADLDVLCLTAMHKDPHRRYRTVEALIRDVDHFLAGEPLEARPDTIRYRLGKFTRRNRGPVLAAGVGLVAIVALMVFYTLRLAAARDEALAEAARAQRIQQFTMNLFQGGDAFVGPADSLRVVTLLERGIQEAAALSAEPATQAELWITLGRIHLQIGQLERADTLLRAGLDQRRVVFGPDHPEVADALVAVGQLREAQAEYEEAEQLVREALEIARRRLPDDHPGITRAVSALGRVLENRGRYDEAVPVLEEAVRRYAAVGVTPELTDALSELANVHFYAGRYAVSDSLNHLLLSMNRQLFGDRHPHVADDLINLGAIGFERGDYATAESRFREGLAIKEAWFGAEHPATAASLTMLGRVLVRQERLDEALEVLQRSLTINERIYGPVHPRVASALNEIGIAAGLRNDLDAAEAAFQRMTEIYRAVYNDRHYYIGIALSNLAGIYHRKGEFTRAEWIFRDVLRRYAEVLDADHQLVGIARIRLGRALLGQKRYAEAVAESSAGYEHLMRTGTAPNWVAAAREDLAAGYTAMGQPGEAARFLTENR